MKNKEPLFFEITNKKNVVRIELSEAFNQRADCTWDKNYILATVHFISETFQGQFETQFMTIDFEKFKRDLKQIYETANGFVEFECLEQPLKLIIKGTGEGYFSLTYVEPGTSQTFKLDFELSFGKRQLLSIISQLEKITNVFPIIGNEFRMTSKAKFNRGKQFLPTDHFSISYHQQQYLSLVDN